jgi:signal transduction histidine kinase
MGKSITSSLKRGVSAGPYFGWAIPILISVLAYSLLFISSFLRFFPSPFPVYYFFVEFIFIITIVTVLLLIRFYFTTGDTYYITSLLVLIFLIVASLLAFMEHMYRPSVPFFGGKGEFIALLYGYFASLAFLPRKGNTGFVPYYFLLTVVVSGLMVSNILYNFPERFFITSPVGAQLLLIFSLLLVPVVFAGILSIQYKKHGDGNFILTGFQYFLIYILIALIVYSFRLPSAPVSLMYAFCSIAVASIFPFWGEVLEREDSSRRRIALEKAISEYNITMDLHSASSESPFFTLSHVVAKSLPDCLFFMYISEDGFHWNISEKTTDNELFQNLQPVLEFDASSILLDPDPNVISETEKLKILRQNNGNYRCIVNISRASSHYGMYGLLTARYFRSCEMEFFKRIMQTVHIYDAYIEAKNRQEILSARLMMIVNVYSSIIKLPGEGGVLERVATLMSEELSLGTCIVWSISSDQGAHPLFIRSKYSEDDLDINALARYAMQAALLKQPVLREDKGAKLHSYFSPVIVDERCVAVLQASSARKFDWSDMRVMDATSNLASMSLSVIRLRKYLEKKKEEATTRADILAHDFKNLLQPVLTNIELLQMFLSKGEYDRKAVMNILQSSKNAIDRAKDLAKKMLELGREEQSGQRLNVYSLSRIVSSCIEAAKSISNERPVEFRVNIPSDADTVQCTPLIDELFMNLITNAIKYNDKELAVISVSATRNGEEIVVHVQDNGPGIDEEKRKTVFERYSPYAQGTGLGLPLAKAIMESSCGSIEIKSPGDGGKGSVIVLRFLSANAVKAVNGPATIT